MRVGAFARQPFARGEVEDGREEDAEHGRGNHAAHHAGADRVPVPVHPAGLRLTAMESAGEVQTPVLGGSADGFYSRDLFERTAARIPLGRAVVWEGRSHVGVAGGRVPAAVGLGYLLAE